MARPRVFLSSTYYDLKSVRVALASFIAGMGYDVILNEAGAIPYGKSDALDIYCYEEIQNCDIVISIIGGRYGATSSGDSGSSISQKELRTALSLGKQVYIFVEHAVLSEFRTYRNNKDKGVKWAHVDNELIYSFIEQLYSLPSNNAIFSFDDAATITDILKEQCSGLFQRLLQERVISSQLNVAQELGQGLSTLRQIIDKVSVSNPPSSSNLADLAIIENSVFSRLKSLLNIKYRVFFISRQEMEDWLKSRGFVQVAKGKWDSATVQEWFERKYTDTLPQHPMLMFDESVFNENGSLKGPEEIEDVNTKIRFAIYDPERNRILDDGEVSSSEDEAAAPTE